VLAGTCLLVGSTHVFAGSLYLCTGMNTESGLDTLVGLASGIVTSTDKSNCDSSYGATLQENAYGIGPGNGAAIRLGTSDIGSGAVLITGPSGITMQGQTSLSNNKIINLASGNVSATSTDAINGSQIYKLTDSTAKALGGGSTVNADGSITAPSYSVGGITVRTVGDAVTNLDTRTTANTNNLSDLKSQIQIGTIGLVQQNQTTRDISVGKDTDGTLINMTGTKGARTVTGVAAGAVNASSTDAINGSQLYKADASVANALGGGSKVNADGTVSAPSYSVDGTTVNNVGDAVTNLDTRTTSNTNNLADLKSQIEIGTIGLVQQDQTTRDISIGKNTDGTLIDVSGTQGARTITGVAAGTLSADSTDAVNGSQLYDTNQKVAQNTADIDNITTSINNGTIGLVQQDQTTRNITVARDTDGTLVDMSGTQGSRTVTGVTAGAVNADSTDVINGSQLYNTSSSVANALGGGSTVNADGTISAPAYSVGGITVNTVGDAVTNLDTRTTANTNNLADLKSQIEVGTIGLVQQDQTTRDITVGKGYDGTLIDMSGTQGARTVTGLAAGAVNADSTDAVNGSQLHAASSSVANALGGGSVVNDDGTVSAPTYSVGGITVRTVGDAVTNLDARTTTNTNNLANLKSQIEIGTIGLVQQDQTTRDITVGKSTDGTLIDVSGTQGARTVTGVAAGLLSASSTDAVNGSQLYATNAHVQNVDMRVSVVASNAYDKGAKATGKDATAVGNGAVASANDSVALGSGSVADQNNTVSVGSAGNERRIVNVAPGVQGTDAVNVNQLSAVQSSVNTTARQAFAGIDGHAQSHAESTGQVGGRAGRRQLQGL
jgi:trimeric autotransporter adhesin